jgi:hypothetical protein
VLRGCADVVAAMKATLRRVARRMVMVGLE